MIQWIGLKTERTKVTEGERERERERGRQAGRQAGRQTERKRERKREREREVAAVSVLRAGRRRRASVVSYVRGRRWLCGVSAPADVSSILTFGNALCKRGDAI